MAVVLERVIMGVVKSTNFSKLPCRWGRAETRCAIDILRVHFQEIFLLMLIDYNFRNSRISLSSLIFLQRIN